MGISCIPDSNPGRETVEGTTAQEAKPWWQIPFSIYPAFAHVIAGHTVTGQADLMQWTEEWA